MKVPEMHLIYLIPTRAHTRLVISAFSFIFTHCAHPAAQHISERHNATPPPAWISGDGINAEGTALCGLGVAGAAYDPASPHPKEMAAERATRNLAGILYARLQEAIFDQNTTTQNSIELARAITVDDALISNVQAAATFDTWRDAHGQGPFGQAGFTYTRACVSLASAASMTGLDARYLQDRAHTTLEDPSTVGVGNPKPADSPRSRRGRPGWLTQIGAQKDGRVCAVGTTLPTFYTDQMFENVVRDIRSQLAQITTTLVASGYEEYSTNNSSTIAATTAASSEGFVKGVIVTDFWLDKDGIGPLRQAGVTYGWGCMAAQEHLGNQSQIR